MIDGQPSARRATSRARAGVTDGAAAYLASPSTGIARRIEPENGTSLKLVTNAHRRLKRLRLAHH